MRPWRGAILLATTSVLWPSMASAHLVGVEFGEFYAGALHLVFAPEHLAFILVLTLIGAQQPREVARWMLLALPVGLSLGCAAAFVLRDPSVGLVELAVPLSLAIAGLCGIWGRRLPAMVLAGLTLGVSAIHGYSNALSAFEVELDPWLYFSGIVVVATVLGTLGIAAMSVLGELAIWARLATRVIASWIATLGVLLAGLTLAG